MNRRWSVLAVGGVGLVILAGLIVLMIVNLGSLDEGANLRLALTLTAQQAMLPTATLMEQATVTPTATVTASTAVPLAGNGFRMEVLSATDTPLIADGVSTRQVRITTDLPDFAGHVVTIVVYGGGQVEPAEITLPAVGESTIVTYTSGRSASKVRLEGTLTDIKTPVSVSTELVSVAEDVKLTADYAPAVTNGTDLFVPVNFLLNNVSGSALSNGQYRLSVSVNDQGALFLRPDAESLGTKADIILTNEGATLYFKPVPGQKKAVLYAQLTNRPDIAATSVFVYWENLASRLDLTETSQPGDNKRYTVDLRSTILRLCALAYNDRNLVIPLNALQWQYSTLLTMDSSVTQSLSIGGVKLQPDTIYRTDKEAFFVSEPDGDATCLKFLPTATGLFKVKVFAERAGVSDEALVILHYGLQQPNQFPPTLVFSSPDVNTPPPTLSLVGSTSPELYALDKLQSMPLLLAAWLPAVYSDSASDGILRPLQGETSIPLVLNLNAYQKGTPPLMLEAPAGIANSYIHHLPDNSPSLVNVDMNGTVETFIRLYVVVQPSA